MTSPDAALVGQFDVFEELIRHGYDVNEHDESGWTPMHWAATGTSEEAIQELIRLGADPNCKAADQLLPIHQAAQNRHVNIMDALLKAGTDVWADNGLVMEELTELANQFHDADMIRWCALREHERYNQKTAGFNIAAQSRAEELREKERAAIIRLQEKKEREARVKSGLMLPSDLESQENLVNRTAMLSLQTTITGAGLALRRSPVVPSTSNSTLQKKPFLDWSIDDICMWLSELHLSENYAPQMRQAQVTGAKLQDLRSSSDWQQCGVWKFGDVRKILKATKQFPFDGTLPEYSAS